LQRTLNLQVECRGNKQDHFQILNAHCRSEKLYKKKIQKKERNKEKVGGNDENDREIEREGS
jgi:hypothetical protein